MKDCKWAKAAPSPSVTTTQKRPFEAVRPPPAFCRSFISRWRITQGNVDGLSVSYWVDS